MYRLLILQLLSTIAFDILRIRFFLTKYECFTWLNNTNLFCIYDYYTFCAVLLITNILNKEFIR